jgi:hypothetical protein
MVNSHENDQSHENRQFRGGVVIFMGVFKYSHENSWFSWRCVEHSHENKFSWRDLHHSHENEYFHESVFSTLTNIVPLTKSLVSGDVQPMQLNYIMFASSSYPIFKKF